MSIEIVFLSAFVTLVGYLIFRIRRAYQLAYIENYRFLHSIGTGKTDSHDNFDE